MKGQNERNYSINVYKNSIINYYCTIIKKIITNILYFKKSITIYFINYFILPTNYLCLNNTYYNYF